MTEAPEKPGFIALKWKEGQFTCPSWGAIREYPSITTSMDTAAFLEREEALKTYQQTLTGTHANGWNLVSSLFVFLTQSFVNRELFLTRMRDIQFHNNVVLRFAAMPPSMVPKTPLQYLKCGVPELSMTVVGCVAEGSALSYLHTLLTRLEDMARFKQEDTPNWLKLLVAECRKPSTGHKIVNVADAEEVPVPLTFPAALDFIFPVLVPTPETQEDREYINILTLSSVLTMKTANGYVMHLSMMKAHVAAYMVRFYRDEPLAQLVVHPEDHTGDDTQKTPASSSD